MLKPVKTIAIRSRGTTIPLGEAFLTGNPEIMGWYNVLTWGDGVLDHPFPAPGWPESPKSSLGRGGALGLIFLSQSVLFGAENPPLKPPLVKRISDY